MAGQRLMASGDRATSSRLSSLVIYHICPSGEAGPSLTLSRTENAIKPVLQEALSLSPSLRAEGAEGLSRLGVGVGQGTSGNASLCRACQEVSSSIARTAVWDITCPATAKVALTASQRAS